MIERRIEYLLERLHPQLLRHGLALSGSTAAAVLALTARDVTHDIDLLTTGPLPRPDAEILADQLRDELAQIQPLLTDAPGGNDEPTRTIIEDDRILITVPTSDRPLTLEVTTIDPDVQPFHTSPRPVRRGGTRFPTTDQVTVARQLTKRWLTDPRDDHRCLEVALAADRVGADALWSERIVADARPLVPDLLTTLRNDAVVQIHSSTIPRRLARQAERGLRDLERHLGPRHALGRSR